MEQTEKFKAITAQQAKTCARKVGTAAALAIAVFFVLGAAIEHRQELAMIVELTWHFIWQTLLFLLSLGGHFWGAVATGATGYAVSAWALCTCYGVYKKEPGADLTKFLWIALAGALVWGLAQFALYGLYDSFKELPVYRALAVAGMFASIFAPIGAAFHLYWSSLED